MIKLDNRAVSLGAVRLTGPEGYYYGPTGTHTGDSTRDHAVIEQIFRQAISIGEVKDDSYAILDAYDENGDIIADYGIPSANVFRFLYRKMNWRRVS